jgi:hypothetical protein
MGVLMDKLKVKLESKFSDERIREKSYYCDNVILL